mgnify:CR=1 FL=1
MDKEYIVREIEKIINNINEINKEILNYGEENENSKGLGTTVVAAIVTKDFLIFANIGDSSGYVIKNNKLHKVTYDHTLVNLLNPRTSCKSS